GGQGALMDSTQNPEESGPDDVAVGALKQARQQIGRPDRRGVNDKIVESELDSSRPWELRSRLSRRSSLGWSALPGLIGLLGAACVGAAAVILQSHGD